MPGSECVKSQEVTVCWPAWRRCCTSALLVHACWTRLLVSRSGIMMDSRWIAGLWHWVGGMFMLQNRYCALSSAAFAGLWSCRLDVHSRAPLCRSTFTRVWERPQRAGCYTNISYIPKCPLVFAGYAVDIAALLPGECAGNLVRPTPPNTSPPWYIIS